MQRFVADRMLGKLAKWLRVFGYDVIYLQQGVDEEIEERLERINRRLDVYEEERRIKEEREAEARQAKARRDQQCARLRAQVRDELIQWLLIGDALSNPVIENLNALFIQCMFFIAQYVGPFHGPILTEFGALE